jgi:plasmid replication initiation protein
MEAYKEKNGYFEKIFEVYELRSLLDVDKKDYSLFSNFKNRIIEPAIKEISDKTDLHINSVLYGKTGRKITNITFSVSTKDETPKQKISPENEGKNHTIIETLVSLGFSLDIAKRYKNKHGIKKIERNIAYTLEKKKAGLVNDIPSYLNISIENDYGMAWDIENQKQAESKKQQAKLEQVKKTDTEKAALDKKARNQQAFNDFLLLPESRQEELKQDFFEKADLTIKAKIKDAQRKQTDIFTSPLVSSPFKVFLIEHGF